MIGLKYKCKTYFWLSRSRCLGSSPAGITTYMQVPAGFNNRKGLNIMTREQKLAILKNRLATLEENPKNIKCPGVLRKLRRQVRVMEQ